MAKTPWLTSDEIVDTVKKRIMVPLSESTFTVDDILDFCNQELMGSQVPSVLQYHEEYFIQRISVPLEQNILRYPIPNRALGMKLRYIFYLDTNNQSYDMTRINPNDQSYFLNNSDSNTNPYRYYVENNEIVLSIGSMTQPVGSLLMGFFMRPNQLVQNAQAATIQSFGQTITIDNTTLAVGDTVVIDNGLNQDDSEITFTIVASSPGDNEFVIGSTSINTASNLVNAINDNGTYSASNSTPATNVVTLVYYNIQLSITPSNSVSMIVPTTQTINCDNVPSTFSNNTFYDILQTKPGHRIINYDVLVGNNAISGTTMTFPAGSLPDAVIIGDYVCLANECIIPQLPPELHNILAERTCARVLSAIGDTEGLQNSQKMIADMELRQGNMVQNRVDGNTQKVLARRSLLHYGKGIRRNIL